MDIASTWLCESASIVSWLWTTFLRTLNFEIGISALAVMYAIRANTSIPRFSRSTFLIHGFIIRTWVAACFVDVLVDYWLDWVAGDSSSWWLLGSLFRSLCWAASPRTARHCALFEPSRFLWSFKWPSQPSFCFSCSITLTLQYSYLLNGVPSECCFSIIRTYQLEHALHLAVCCPLSVNWRNIGFDCANPFPRFQLFLFFLKELQQEQQLRHTQTCLDPSQT